MLPLKYSISEDDFVAAGLLALKTRSRRQSAQLWLLPILGVLSIAGGLFYHKWTNHPAGDGDWTGVAVGCLIGLFLLQAGLGYKASLRKQYRKVKSFGGERSLEADDQGIPFTSQVVDAHSR